MAANQNDYFKKAGANTVTTLAAPGKGLAASSITVGSTANFPTDTGIIIGIRQVDTDGALVAGTYSEWKATVTSGTTLAISTTPVLGSDQVYPAGSTTQVFIPISSSAHNDLVDGILEFANQDGTLQTAPVQAALGVTTLPSGGWDTLNAGTPPTVSSGYNKGNREYDLTFANVDLSSTLSPGMRLKLDRTGTTPTQCTDLESSSSQYWSKTSPSGISFTDDFTCEAWIKLESYGSVYGIVARRNADVEGWSMEINTDGTLRIASLRIASNNRTITTTQSIPLERWVHVAATMDNSTNTHTTYIDGVSVPNTITTNGTITALVQGTTALVVGAYKSAGTNPFDGEIADVRVWSAVRTATQIRDNMNQQLVGNETNLVAYFKLNGDGNDSTSNANNLTAQNSATATTVDNPMKSTEYAIVTKVAYSAPNTTVTVFTGTDHNIPNMTLQNPFYSTQASPFGFPRDRGKWILFFPSNSDAALNTGTSMANSSGLYNTIPTGAWNLSYKFSADAERNGGSVVAIIGAIGEAISDAGAYPDTFWYIESRSPSIPWKGSGSPIGSTYKVFQTPTTVYMLDGGLHTSGNFMTTIGSTVGLGLHYIKAECAYI